MEYGKKDFRIGDILTTKKGYKYILVVDEDGSWGVITTPCNGKTPGLCNYVLFDVDGNMYIDKKKDDNGKIVMVERFDCDPGVNRLSEALKFITGRFFSAKIYTIWEDDKNGDVDDILQQMKDKGVTIDDVMKKLRNK